MDYQRGIPFVYVLPMLAAILCYINGLDGDFVHDDKYAIKDNPDANGKATVDRLFWNDFWGKSMCYNTSHKSYRPLTVLTFRLNYHLGGGSPRSFHVVNLALHAAVTWLFVHTLLQVVHVQNIVAGAAGLLFAVHPVHTEAVMVHSITMEGGVERENNSLFSKYGVTGIVGRAELLSCLGVLLSLICYARSLGIDHRDTQPDASSSQRWWDRALYFWLAMGISAAAMLCKEHGITGLGICAVLDVFVFSRQVVRRWVLNGHREPGFRGVLGRVATTGCVITMLLAFRLWTMCGRMPNFREEDNPASFSSSLLTRILTFNYLVAFNVWLLLCPRVLSYDWQGGSIPVVADVADVRNMATLAVYVIIGWAAFTCLRSFVKKNDMKKAEDHNNNPTKSDAATSSGHNVLLVSMVLMGLPFLPSSNLFFRVGFVVAERVLYIPSLGFCLLVADGAVKLWQKYTHGKHWRGGSWCFILSATAVLALFATKTYTRNFVWRSRESLFWSGLQTLPHNAKVHYNYANFLKDSGDHQQAVEHYKAAIRLNPRQSSYHNNLGTVLEDKVEAEACYRAALNLHPTHRGALVNLGNLLINRNESSAGEQLLHKALDIDPRYMDALLSLSQLELRLGRWDRAEIFIKEALKQRPDLPDLYNYYGILFHKTGQYEEAVASYRRAVSLDSTYTPAMTNAAATLKHLGRELEAEALLKMAIAARQDVEALGQLGQLYQNAGRTQDALDVYRQMALKAPNDTNALLGFVHTLIDSGELKQAEEMLTSFLSRSPHNAKVLFVMGHVQMGLGNTQEVISVFQEALRWAGHSANLMAKIHYELGNVYKDLKMYTQALENYQSAVASDSTLTHAHHNLGALYHLTGHYDQAQYHYEYVLRLEPGNQMLLQNLARLKRAAEQNAARHTSN